MTPHTTPTKLDLKKDEKLSIHWQDGAQSVYSLSLLRTMCPCALCRIVREGRDPHQILQADSPKTRLTVLPGNFAEPLSVISASLVGNYALKIAWSDDHDSGIYSFEYLRQIAPEHA